MYYNCCFLSSTVAMDPFAWLTRSHIKSGKTTFPLQATLFLSVVLDYSQQQSKKSFKDENKHVY